MQKTLKIIFRYTKDRLGFLLTFVLFSIIFSTLSFLYGLPLDGVCYAVLVCAVFCVAVGAIDFQRYRSRHLEIKQLAESIFINADNAASFELTEAKTLQEQNYQEVLNNLHNALTSITTKSNLKYSEMKDFYALWVHQIKTPISAMSIILQNDKSENAKTLQAELFKIERYTEIVLNYLRLEDVSSDLCLAEYKLESIVKEVVKKLAPVFISKNISIALENLDFCVISDEKWLTFALEQLLTNSLKYTRNGGQIRIYSDESCTLTIQDNGIGISPEDLPRIFEKGFTGYNGRMDKKATGIGLYLTKRTMDKLGHKIKIQSDGISGTKVILDLTRENTVYE